MASHFFEFGVRWNTTCLLPAFWGLMPTEMHYRWRIVCICILEQYVNDGGHGRGSLRFPANGSKQNNGSCLHNYVKDPFMQIRLVYRYAINHVWIVRRHRAVPPRCVARAQWPLISMIALGSTLSAMASHMMNRFTTLSLHQLIQDRLLIPECAFLAACDPAWEDISTPDEVIHLSPVLQFSGFHTIIGTTQEIE